MKLKIIFMIFLMLMIPIISFSVTAISIGTDKITEIKVSIIRGSDEFNQTQYEYPFNALNDYYWTINNQTYNFTPKIYINCITKENERKIFLNNDNTDVLIADGVIRDQKPCALIEGLRDIYERYICNGGGYIGRCGGSSFPLPLYNTPNTITELYGVDKCSFLEGMGTHADIRAGDPVISQYIGIKIFPKGRTIPWLRGLFNHDVNATGTGAYGGYNVYNNQSTMKGVPVNLTDLEKTHPIFKDYCLHLESMIHMYTVLLPIPQIV